MINPFFCGSGEVCTNERTRKRKEEKRKEEKSSDETDVGEALATEFLGIVRLRDNHVGGSRRHVGRGGGLVCVPRVFRGLGLDPKVVVASRAILVALLPLSASVFRASILKLQPEAF